MVSYNYQWHINTCCAQYSNPRGDNRHTINTRKCPENYSFVLAIKINTHSGKDAVDMCHSCGRGEASNLSKKFNHRLTNCDAHDEVTNLRLHLNGEIRQIFI